MKPITNSWLKIKASKKISADVQTFCWKESPFKRLLRRNRQLIILDFDLILLSVLSWRETRSKVFGPYRSHFLSKKSLIAAENETKEKRRKEEEETQLVHVN